jgi:hypothetical protein
MLKINRKPLKNIPFLSSFYERHQIFSFDQKNGVDMDLTKT